MKKKKTVEHARTHECYKYRGESTPRRSFEWKAENICINCTSQFFRVQTKPNMCTISMVRRILMLGGRKLWRNKWPASNKRVCVCVFYQKGSTPTKKEYKHTIRKRNRHQNDDSPDTNPSADVILNCKIPTIFSVHYMRASCAWA